MFFGLLEANGRCFEEYNEQFFTKVGEAGPFGTVNTDGGNLENPLAFMQRKHYNFSRTSYNLYLY
jgi:hypothetical protein